MTGPANNPAPPTVSNLQEHVGAASWTPAPAESKGEGKAEEVDIGEEDEEDVGEEEEEIDLLQGAASLSGGATAALNALDEGIPLPKKKGGGGGGGGVGGRIGGKGGKGGSRSKRKPKGRGETGRAGRSRRGRPRGKG